MSLLTHNCTDNVQTVHSDHLATLHAYDEWQTSKHSGAERSFCWDNFLSLSTLQSMEDMRYQFLNVLADIGFVDKSRNQQVISMLYEVGALQKQPRCHHKLLVTQCMRCCWNVNKLQLTKSLICVIVSQTASRSPSAIVPLRWRVRLHYQPLVNPLFAF